ncbi:MAG: metallophosphoesterase [Anaerovoracaceae bacterium]|nr:metallophosphoesterase [Clostridiales bacterium]
MKNTSIILALLVAAIMLVGLSACKPADSAKPTSIQASIDSGQGFKFFIISDPHYLSDELHDDKEAFNRFLSYGDKLIHYSEELIDTVTVDIIREKPDFLLVTGDLTCNGEMVSHKELAEKFKRIEDSGTSVFVVPGNHDILNPRAKQYFENTIWETDFITRDMFADIYADFGYNEAVSRDKRSLSYLVTPSEDVWFLMLDSAIYNENIKKNNPLVGGIINDSTIEWIQQCSKMAKVNNAEIIAVMHHSLVDHSKLINQDYTIQNSEEIVKLFADCDIRVCFTGHIHLQDIKTAKVDDKMIIDIATSCLIVYPNQYGVVTYNPNEGYHYETKRVDMKKYASNERIKDENLLSFEQYSIDFFLNKCCNTQNQCLSLMAGYLTAEEEELVRDIVTKMNLRYFAGFRNEMMDDLVNTEGYRILQSLPPCFNKAYVENILNDEISNNNVYFIPIN